MPAGGLTWWRPGSPAWQLPEAPALPLADLYRAACREAERQARERAFALQGQAKSRLAREMARVTGYYTRMIREIEHKLAATGDEAKKERLVKQLAAVEADRQRREKDTLDRYAVEVELYLDHLVDYRLPLLHVGLEVQHKKQVLPATVLYNPFAHRLETPVCPLCGRGLPCACFRTVKTGWSVSVTRHKKNPGGDNFNPCFGAKGTIVSGDFSKDERIKGDHIVERLGSFDGL